ncbi:MAG: hypothetical protein ACRETZ_08345 [Steroidobacteraceae bacterium]
MRNLAEHLNEDHRYFPEWADRPEIQEPPAEADHNSYLAGGYSEEFGYHVSIDRPPVFAPLEGDPDGSRLWYVHITGLHPGYPECGRPDDRERFRWHSGTEEALRARTARIHIRDSTASSREPPRPIRVIRVGERARQATRHGGLARRLASFWSRWRGVHPGLDR